MRRDETGRGGSRYLHDHVRPGMTLAISHPVNLFPMEQRARKNLLIAGGIGITPFLAMIEQLRDGLRWRWINRPLGLDDTFTFGEATTLPHRPTEYITRQSQGDPACLTSATTTSGWTPASSLPRPTGRSI